MNPLVRLQPNSVNVDPLTQKARSLFNELFILMKQKKKGCKHLGDTREPGPVQCFELLLPGGFTSPSEDRSDRRERGRESAGGLNGER